MNARFGRQFRELAALVLETEGFPEATARPAAARLSDAFDPTLPATDIAGIPGVTVHVRADAQPSWSTVFTGLPGALLSVSGSSDTDVWAVGSDSNDGKGPLVLQFDGASWKRYLTGITGDLWWAHVCPNGRIFAGGSLGTILRPAARWC